MSKPTILVSAPVTTRSGYGARSRDVVRALVKLGKYDVYVNPVPWGNTPQNALALDDPNDKIIVDRFLNRELKPDVHIHIVVPNEFAPIGKYNIGMTAGLESTAIPQEWIPGINRMNLVLASSKFGAEVMKQTAFTNNETKEIIKATTPIKTLFEGADTNLYKPTNECSKVLAESMDDIKEDWNFLFVGHWLQGPMGHDRKDVGGLVKTFLETFKASQGVGLILKTGGAALSAVDSEEILVKLTQIRSSVENDDMPNVYFMGADLFDSEVNDLYNHPKVKAHITFTHGEGYGRPLLEASLSEKPIIAPNWSGHTDFISAKHSTLLPGGMIPVHKESLPSNLYLEGQSWFGVDYKAAARIMRDVKLNYRKYKLKARKQAKVNKIKFSLDAMTRTLGIILDNNLPEFTQTVDVKLPKLNLPKLEKV